ncbi:MAG TPA: LptF/LptG family permease [Exilispira sp.]|nr:LptF/LptG family permease [Exilispira sp.]HQM88667.1 LptF/LptG family permease [Exilispira sp.]
MRVPFKIGIYLVKKFILPFIVISVLVVFLYIVQDFILNVNKYMKMDLNSLFKYYLYWIPYIYLQMYGVALLFSTIYVISTLNTTSELLAINASGISTLSMSIMLIILIFLITLVFIITQDSFVVDNYRKKIAIERKFFPKKIEQDNFNIRIKGHGDKIYYVERYFDKAKTIEGVRIVFYRKQDGIRHEIIAEKGEYIGKGIWELFNVNEYIYSSRDETLKKNSYDKKSYNLKDEPDLFQKSIYEMELMHISEGFQYVKLLRKYKINNYKDEFDFYGKFVFPISGFFISLFGIAAGKFFKKNTLVFALITCIIIYGLYYFILNSLFVLGRRGFADPLFSALIGPILFLFLGIFSITKADLVR